MIKVDANLFRIVYAAVSTEETRYYLNGVHIEPHHEKGAILVSTDGHRMIVAYDPDGECSEHVIVKLPRLALAQCKMPALRLAKRILEIDPALPGTATIQEITPGAKGELPRAESILSIPSPLVDGTYPDWRRITPAAPVDSEKVGLTSFSPRDLKTWGEVGIELKKAGFGANAMQISLSTGMDPVVIRWSGALNIFGIQMPIRNFLEGHLPAFFALPALQQAKAA